MKRDSRGGRQTSVAPPGLRTRFGMRMNWVHWLVLACLAANTAAAATASTRDGLSIDFKDADASVASISITNTPLKLLANSPGGFYVCDLAADKLLGKMGYRSQTF